METVHKVDLGDEVVATRQQAGSRLEILDEATATRLAATFSVLSDPTRIRIISALAARAGYAFLDRAGPENDALSGVAPACASQGDAPGHRHKGRSSRHICPR